RRSSWLSDKDAHIPAALSGKNAQRAPDAVFQPQPDYSPRLRSAGRSPPTDASKHGKLDGTRRYQNVDPGGRECAIWALPNLPGGQGLAPQPSGRSAQADRGPCGPDL